MYGYLCCVNMIGACLDNKNGLCPSKSPRNRRPWATTWPQTCAHSISHTHTHAHNKQTNKQAEQLCSLYLLSPDVGFVAKSNGSPGGLGPPLPSLGLVGHRGHWKIGGDEGGKQVDSSLTPLNAVKSKILFCSRCETCGPFY
jgi:hypothetical protein